MEDAVVEVVERVRAWIEREGAPRPGDEVVVGCSGGGDSTALLVALATLGRWPLHAVYVDHQLRPGTDGEARHVAALATATGAGFTRVRVNVPRHGNLLAQARIARYGALAALAQRRGARFVAVAHTATDQAETVVFRAARGDVAHALAGMPARRLLDNDIELLRPLLEVTRAAAAAFVAARGHTVVDDPSNARLDLTRIRIRRGLAPLDGLSAGLCRLADHTAAWLRTLDEQAAALGPLDALPAVEVAAAGSDVALRLLRRAGLHRAGHAHARALLALAAATGGTRSIDLGGGLVAERSYHLLRLGAPTAADPGDVSVPVAGPGRYRLLDCEVTLGAGRAPVADTLLADRLRGALELRNLRPGDRLRTPNGHRKLSDLFTDRKVPRAARRRLPLLTCDGVVVWVATVGAASDLRTRPGDGAERLSLHVDSDLTCAIMLDDRRRQIAAVPDAP